jgi:hypothetical protein
MLNRVTISIAFGALWASGVQAQEVYVQGGTQGLGVGAALGISPNFGVHADFKAFNLSHDFAVDGNRYQGDIRLRQGGLYLDYFPWSSVGFRVTGGVLFTDDTLTGVSTPTSGTYDFGGKRYPAVPGESSTASARYPTVMPYFGFRFGHRPTGKGFGFIADLGVA